METLWKTKRREIRRKGRARGGLKGDCTNRREALDKGGEKHPQTITEPRSSAMGRGGPEGQNLFKGRKRAMWSARKPFFWKHHLFRKKTGSAEKTSLNRGSCTGKPRRSRKNRDSRRTKGEIAGKKAGPESLEKSTYPLDGGRSRGQSLCLKNKNRLTLP